MNMSIDKIVNAFCAGKKTRELVLEDLLLKKVFLACHCTHCFAFMGFQNPRQLCSKWRCDYEEETSEDLFLTRCTHLVCSFEEHKSSHKDSTCSINTKELKSHTSSVKLVCDLYVAMRKRLFKKVVDGMLEFYE